MQTTLVDLPLPIEKVITQLLARKTVAWLARAQALHRRYRQQDQDNQQPYVQDELDALAYLGLRATATYAQLFGALAAAQEMLPTWQPQSLLDLGCGPGTALWALPARFPTLRQATCVDQNTHFLSLGQRIVTETHLPVTAAWHQADLTHSFAPDSAQYDLVIMANVLNELSGAQRATLLHRAFACCCGLMVVLEPGTPVGSAIIQEAAQALAAEGQLIAPYLGHHFVEEPWLHFPQRFTRPEFARRFRQEMRASDLMASDWEEAKYSYVVVGRTAAAVQPWGRTIGPVTLMNGYLELPVLTQAQASKLKVMKRHKQQYAFAKKLRWGQLIWRREDLIYP